MTSYDEFLSRVAVEIRDFLPKEHRDEEISISEVEKENGIKLAAISIHKKGMTGAVGRVYLEDFYKNLCDGQPFDEVMEELVKTYYEWQAMAKLPDDLQNLVSEPDILMDYEQSKRRIIPRLCKKGENDERIKDIVHVERGGLWVTYHMYTGILTDVNKNRLVTTTPLQKDWFDKFNKEYGVTIEELEKQAWKNRSILFPTTVEKVSSLISHRIRRNKNEVRRTLGNTSLFVLSNEYHAYGATALFDEQALRSLSDKYGILLLLPFTVDEIIAVPEKECTRNLIDYLARINFSLATPETALIGAGIFIYMPENNAVINADQEILQMQSPSELTEASHFVQFPLFGEDDDC